MSKAEVIGSIGAVACPVCWRRVRSDVGESQEIDRLDFSAEAPDRLMWRQVEDDAAACVPVVTVEMKDGRCRSESPHGLHLFHPTARFRFETNRYGNESLQMPRLAIACKRDFVSKVAVGPDETARQPQRRGPRQTMRLQMLATTAK